MKMKKFLKFGILAAPVVLMAVVGVCSVAFAQAQPPINISGQTAGTLPNFTIAALISWVIKIIIVAAFVIAFIFLLIGGVRWILAGGDEKAIASARGMVVGALIGLFIVLAAFAIIRLVEYFFNVNIISGNLVIPQIGSTSGGSTCLPGCVWDSTFEVCMPIDILNPPLGGC